MSLFHEINLKLCHENASFVPGNIKQIQLAIAKKKRFKLLRKILLELDALIYFNNSQ